MNRGTTRLSFCVENASIKPVMATTTIYHDHVFTSKLRERGDMVYRISPDPKSTLRTNASVPSIVLWLLNHLIRPNRFPTMDAYSHSMRRKC
jgi:hypothetical protein